MQNVDKKLPLALRNQPFRKTTPVKRTFDIKAVEEFIKINVLRDHKTVSMSELQEIYGDKTQKDIYVRHNMKKKIVKAFGNKLIFYNRETKQS